MKHQRKRIQLLTTDDSLTEPEHADSCDVNKMIKAVLRGQQVRGSNYNPVYGHDDMNMDLITHRNLKAATEAELLNIAANNEFSQEELDLIPKSIKEKIQFKVRKKEDPKSAPKNDDPNDKTVPLKDPPKNEPT